MNLAGYHQIQQNRYKHQIYTYIVLKYTRISFLNPITFSMIWWHFFRFNCITRQTEAAESTIIAKDVGKKYYTLLLRSSWQLISINSLGILSFLTHTHLLL